VRTLRRNASVTLLVVGGLALGIGANTAVYSLIDNVLVRKLPVPAPDRLVIVGDPTYVDSRGHGTPDGLMYSYPLYIDVRDRARAFNGLAAVGSPDRVDARFAATSDAAEHPHGRLVSGNYFSVLGVGAALGRTLGPSAEDPTSAAEATISYDYWMRRFHGDSSIVGKNFLIDDVRTTVTGVAARAFTGEIVGAPIDIWLPLALRDRFHPAAPILGDRRMMWLLLIGRKQGGLTFDQVRAQTRPIVESSILASATPEELSDIRERRFTIAFARGARGLSTVRDTFGRPLLALMLGVALLLGIVCVNVANLLLARGMARRREMALRTAIGASRTRIVRQLLTESLLLALVSCVAALVVSWWGSRALVAMAAQGDFISIPLGINARLAGFAFGLSLLSVIVFGVVPALRASHVDAASTLRATSRSVMGGARFGMLLIAGQVALSLVLLVAASVVARSLRRTESTALGFDRDHLIVVDLDISTPGDSATRLANTVHTIRDGVSAVPGVAAVSYSMNGIFSGSEWHTDVNVAGFQPRTSKDSSTAADRAGAGYAKTLGARLIAGRDFDARDEGGAARTALVNESFARFYFGGANPVGRFARFDDTTVAQIVGEIADVRGQSLDTTAAAGAARRIYIPYLYLPGETKWAQPRSLRLLVRTSVDPSRLVQPVRRAIAEADHVIPIDDIEPVSQLIRFSIRDETLVAQLAGALGSLALLLAAIGLFGVTSYSMARRAGEFGVRMALGAQRADVARLALRDGLRPVVLGVIIGTPVSVLAMKSLERQLNGVMSDPTSVVLAVAVLLGGAMLALIAPVRRATMIDPNAALREE
jgi:predicted permease